VTDPKRPQFGAADMEIESITDLFKGFFKLQKYRLRHRLFAGGWSRWFERELLERGHAAAMLLYDPKLDQVVMVEQFRVGAIATSESPWQMELVAGMFGPLEQAEEVVRRESVEEAGIEPARCEKISSYLPSAGGMTERIDLFVGEVDASQAGGVYGLADEDEDILVHVMSREEAYACIETGRVDNAAAIIALQWLALHHQQLRKRWSHE
jgi:ADP-ribose pyrophosphatase